MYWPARAAPAARADQQPAQRQRPGLAVAETAVVVAEVQGSLELQVGPVARHDEVPLGPIVRVVAAVGAGDRAGRRPRVQRRRTAGAAAPQRPAARRGAEDAIGQPVEPPLTRRAVADTAGRRGFLVGHRPVRRVEGRGDCIVGLGHGAGIIVTRCTTPPCPSARSSPSADRLPPGRHRRRGDRRRAGADLVATGDHRLR